MENTLRNTFEGLKEGLSRRRCSDAGVTEASADSIRLSRVGMALKNIPNWDNKIGPLYSNIN